MGEFVSLKNSEKAKNWKHNVIPESNPGRANNVPDEDFGGLLMVMADAEQR
jgi:hypothetical protein